MKSPLPIKGRFGPKSLQDWYQTLVSIEKVWKPGAKILVVSSFVAEGQEPETDLYMNELERMGISKQDIVVIRKGNETISQLDAALDYCELNQDKIILVSTWLHAPRVWWLTRKMHLDRRIAFGIPRPKEAVTDVILMFLFPLLDICGLREWFLKKVVGDRREKGKL